MVEVSGVRYASSGDVDIAYRVIGDGPVDLISVEGAFSHLEVNWELPAYRRYYERLGEVARCVVFDKRGMGMSDRVSGATTLETRSDDIRAVMDAIDSERAFIMGESEGGPLSILFAAAHPDRCRGLILHRAEVRERRDEDWPWGEASQEEFDASMVEVPEVWGELLPMFERFAPSVDETAWYNEWAIRLRTNAFPPKAAIQFMSMAFDIDIRDVVATIKLPTLILHMEGDRVCHVENARYLARHIEGSRYVELPGEDHLPWFDADAALREIVEFITGGEAAPVPERILTTVLFTDIVGSTEMAAKLGDEAWRSLLEDHYAIVRSNLRKFRGVEVNTGGDSFYRHVRWSCPCGAMCASRLCRGASARHRDSRRSPHRGGREARRRYRGDGCPYRCEDLRPRWPVRRARLEHGDCNYRWLRPRARASGNAFPEGCPRRLGAVRRGLNADLESAGDAATKNGGRKWSFAAARAEGSRGERLPRLAWHRVHASGSRPTCVASFRRNNTSDCCSSTGCTSTTPSAR